MAPRKFVRVSMIIDHTKVYDLLEIAEGNALAGSLEIVPVRHGGEKESGALTPAPSATTFVDTHLAEHGRIVTKEIVPAAEKAGLTRGSIYARLKKLTDEKILKRTEVGTYVASGRNGRAPPAKKDQSNRPKAARGSGQSAVERLVALVAAKQNGSNGATSADLKAAMKAAGYKPAGVGPALSLLITKGRLVRVGKGEYRTARAHANGQQSSAEA